MFLFIIQDDEPYFDLVTLFLFIGLAIVWFLFNKYKSRFSKKSLWIMGGIIIVIGIFLSIYAIPSDSVLFGVVVIFFGIIVMPLRDILAKFKSKTIESKSKTSIEENDVHINDYNISKSQELILEGKKYKTNKRYKKAIDSFVKALSIDPGSEESWFELGEINLIRNRIPEALTCYKRAVDNNPVYTKAIERFKEVKQKLKDSKNEQNQK
ncbi:MAG: tetratricopeptide repeat protein [Promethearchaeota archaeon]